MKKKVKGKAAARHSHRSAGHGAKKSSSRKSHKGTKRSGGAHGASRTGKSKVKKAGRVATYIPGFDALVKGGLKAYSTNIIIGASGTGKSIFSTQFLVEGMKRGEHCLYVTFEEKKEQFYENMKSFGWDLEKYEKKGHFTFLEYTPIKVKTMLEEGGGAIESVILKNKTSRIVIDSITSFMLLFENELEKREATLSLFNMIKRWSCTSLITFEGETKGSDKAEKAIEFESDAIISIYFARGKVERERYIEVIKMRGTDHSMKLYPLKLGKKGIVISRKPAKKFAKEIVN